MKISTATIARTIMLITALANQLLTAMGKNPLPWSDTEVYEAVTVVATVAASLWAWWKNNSFTQTALIADAYKKELDVYANK